MFPPKRRQSSTHKSTRCCEHLCTQTGRHPSGCPCAPVCLQLSDRAQRQEAQIQALQAQVDALTQQAGGLRCRAGCASEAWRQRCCNHVEACCSLLLLRWRHGCRTAVAFTGLLLGACRHRMRPKTPQFSQAEIAGFLAPSGPLACTLQLPQNGALSERASTLTANISSLYNTAKLELARKDAQIRELREK